MRLLSGVRRRLWVFRDGLKNRFLGKVHREKVFSSIYVHNRWNDAESRSGGGSSRAATERLRVELPAILAKFNCRSLLDAPCGDFAWMKEIAPLIERYVGVDIVGEMIEKNRAINGNERVSFEHKDLTCDALPKADIILCRDCFIHLPTKSIRAALANFKRSGARYLLLTNSPGVDYVDVAVGSFRKVDFMRAPFHFPKPLATINEEDGRDLSLWELDFIR